MRYGGENNLGKKGLLSLILLWIQKLVLLALKQDNEAQNSKHTFWISPEINPQKYNMNVLLFCRGVPYERLVFPNVLITI